MHVLHIRTGVYAAIDATVMPKRPREGDDASYDTSKRYLLLQLLVMCSSLSAALILLLMMQHEALQNAARVSAAADEACFALQLYCMTRLFRRAFGETKTRGANRDYDLTCDQMADRSPMQFMRNFRMSKDTFQKICDRLWTDKQAAFAADQKARKDQGLNAGGRPPSLRVHRRRLYMTIWFLANGCSYRLVGEQFGHNCDFDTLMIRELAALAPEFVVFPHTKADIKSASRAFWLLRGFKHCIGAIDGTFIRILAPWKSGRAKVSTCGRPPQSQFNQASIIGQALLAVCVRCCA